MWQWFKKIKKKRREERLRIERQWKVIIANDIGLWHPLRYRPVELWYKWAEMQAKVLSNIQQQIRPPYMRSLPRPLQFCMPRLQ